MIRIIFRTEDKWSVSI